MPLYLVKRDTAEVGYDEYFVDRRQDAAHHRGCHRAEVEGG
jgi:hypothetical protein